MPKMQSRCKGYEDPIEYRCERQGKVIEHAAQDRQPSHVCNSAEDNVTRVSRDHRV
jgi:hypothetical protein